VGRRFANCFTGIITFILLLPCLETGLMASMFLQKRISSPEWVSNLP
jgi:hypothetical protein